MRHPAQLAMPLALTSAIAWAGNPASAQDTRDADINGPYPMDLGRFCSSTSDAALQACKSEIQDEYWIGTGKCMNLRDARDRTRCLADVEAALVEGEALCRAQFSAREVVCRFLGQYPYDPIIRRGDFLSPAQAASGPNRYFPLVPGTTWRYTQGHETIDVMVTDQTVEILGVTCFVLKDVVRVNGEVIEDTVDWYAMDKYGSVWYFGEHSETWEGGELVSLDGSWKAGVDGAKAGIIMRASPAANQFYRQEFLLGDAEDLGQVISTTASENVPGASCDGNCVVTRDFTPIEPDHEAHKYYAPGVGAMLEVDPQTGDRVELVEFNPGPGLLSNSDVTKLPARGLLSQVRVAGEPGSPVPGAEWAIQLDLVHDADVNVDVYDPAGRRIQSLFAGPRGVGNHTFRWGGTDDHGQRVANGIYFVRVRAGAESQTRRLVVLRR